MVRNRTIQVRLHKDQYERIKLYSQNRGFSSLSAYMRYVALHQDFTLIEKVTEIHRHLLGDPPKSRTKKRGMSM